MRRGEAAPERNLPCTARKRVACRRASARGRSRAVPAQVREHKGIAACEASRGRSRERATVARGTSGNPAVPDGRPDTPALGTSTMRAMRTHLLLLLLLASACTATKPTEPWTGPTSGEGPTEEVAVPSLGITIRVPSGTDVAHLGSGATFYVAPGSRSGRSFSLEMGEPAVVHGEAATSRQEKKLPGGNLIRYEIRSADGGSGGAEEFLDGAIVVGQDVFAVHCHDQAEEPAKPSAAWCLEWLATARTAK